MGMEMMMPASQENGGGNEKLAALEARLEEKRTEEKDLETRLDVLRDQRERGVEQIGQEAYDQFGKEFDELYPQWVKTKTDREDLSHEVGQLREQLGK